MKRFFIPLLLLAVSCSREPSAPAPFGPVPTEAQLRWQKMEMNMFCHFGPNTFSGKEWGDGTEPEDIFNPSEMDCTQWVDVAKAGGFGSIIITAKHHDGFCLWPNPASDHTVAQSTWKYGRGDVLDELSRACRAGGLKFGVYVSPWDRNAPTYGTPEYNEVYRQTLEDVHTKYGDIFEHWFDGANGEGPNGKRQVYDWNLFHSEIRKHHPEAVMFSDIGPGCRWVGNERGVAGRTNWSRLDTEGFEPGAGAPPTDTLNSGNKYGKDWVPAEVDVPIRDGWFYHEGDRIKSLQELLDIYYTSVGRNGLLLLNVGPDERGLIPTQDSLRIVEFRSALDQIFSQDLARGSAIIADKTRGRGYEASNLLNEDYDSFWATGDDDLTAQIVLKLPEQRTFNRIMLQEYIPLGQRIAAFRVDAMGTDGEWETIARETTIGYKRIVKTASPISTTAVRLVIESSLACPVLNRFGLFLDTVSE